MSSEPNARLAQRKDGMAGMALLRPGMNHLMETWQDVSMAARVVSTEDAYQGMLVKEKSVRYD
jgi:hypothetical protein